VLCGCILPLLMGLHVARQFCSYATCSRLQLVKTLKEELSNKEEDLKKTTEKLTEASKSLAAKVETMSSFRKASNDLRAKITANAQQQQVCAKSDEYVTLFLNMQIDGACSLCGFVV
jgi:capsule polysaccharide export protein KpsE/RkpR